MPYSTISPIESLERRVSILSRATSKARIRISKSAAEAIQRFTTTSTLELIRASIIRAVAVSTRLKAGIRLRLATARQDKICLERHFIFSSRHQKFDISLHKSNASAQPVTYYRIRLLVLIEQNYLSAGLPAHVTCAKKRFLMLLIGAAKVIKLDINKPAIT